MEPGVEVLSDKGLRIASDGNLLCCAHSDSNLTRVMPQVRGTLLKGYMLQCCTFVEINGHETVIKNIHLQHHGQHVARTQDVQAPVPAQHSDICAEGLTQAVEDA